MSETNPFGDLETEFQNVDKAQPGMSSGRLPAHNAYKGIVVPFDWDGNGETSDKKFFTTPTGTKAVKIALEILSPDKVGEEEVKGRTFEHVFWITAKNLPYVKRDASIVLGRDVTSLKNDLLDAVWAGKTVEFGLKDEVHNGFVQSKATHFNAWSPEPSKGAAPSKGGSAGATTSAQTTAAKKTSQQTTAKTAAGGKDVDF